MSGLINWVFSLLVLQFFYWIASFLFALINFCSNGVVPSVYFGDLLLFLVTRFVLFLIIMFCFMS
jgi:hypothetical protein